MEVLGRLRTHFLTLHQVSSLHQVSAKCTHAHDAGVMRVKHRSKRQHDAHEYTLLIPGARLKKMRKELIQPATRSTDPAVRLGLDLLAGWVRLGGYAACWPPTWAANRPRAAARLRAAIRPPVICSPRAKTAPPVAVQNLFVLVAAPNIWTNLKVKISSF